MKIALVNCLHSPQDDFDAPPLAAACAARGHAGQVVAWDDPGVDWTRFDAVLLRATWNYFHDRPRFLAWAEHVSGVSRLWNPLALVRWNTHKFYLRDLAAHGVPVVPTVFVDAGSPVSLTAILDAQGWDSAVLKPAVSADSFATLRVERAHPAAGERHLEEHQFRDMLVQHYLPAVVEPGERCLVFLDGEFSHAVRKRSLFLGGRHAGPEGVPVAAEPDEIAAAERILAHVPELAGGPAPLYARVDLLRDPDKVPRLLELELVEPSLFFDDGPGSADKLVHALENRLRAAP